MTFFVDVQFELNERVSSSEDKEEEEKRLTRVFQRGMGVDHRLFVTHQFIWFGRRWMKLICKWRKRI